MTDYDRDPAALAWARTKIQHDIDRLTRYHTSAKAAGADEQAETWRRMANRLRRTFIGDSGCVIGAFDERLPDLRRAVDNALPAPIDRAIRRDHSLCGVEPCSDCR